MARSEDYAERLRQSLALTLPDLDTAIGTVPRKIIDAVSELAAEVSVDNYLLNYVYDIDTKAGSDLEDFCRLFGFSRLPARRSTGTISFASSTPATANVLIPVGTQIKSETVPQMVFATVVPAVLVIGNNSVDVPIQAVTAGAAGNVSAFTIERFVNPISGITSFSNSVATTGGADPESDQSLRERFKATIFRNLAGTEDNYLATCLEDEAVTQANVIGPVKRHYERLELVSGTATSTVQDAASIYEASSVAGEDIRGGSILIPDIHYEFDHTVNPPEITSIDTTAMPDGIYDLEFEYVPLASRNDPTNGITNRIDIYVDGQRPTIAVETREFSNDIVFDNSGVGLWDKDRWQRPDGSTPVVGNSFMAFANAPVSDASISDQITIGAETYDEGTHYYLVNDITPVGGAWRSLSGIEWRSVLNGGADPIPADGTVFTVEYLFNAVPRDVDLALRDWRLVTTDVWVHQAITIYLDIFLVVMLEPGFSEDAVLPTLEFDLRQLLSLVGFTGVLQTSDVLSVATQVAGIDAARFATSTDDAAAYAIERVSSEGTFVSRYATGGRATDVQTGDSEILALNSLTLTVKAQNSYGTV